MLKGVGIHVFAGGFTEGIQRAGHQVDTQLEVHGFGLDTARAMCNINPINCPAKEWPNVDAQFAFGNPRCTGFSTITSGYDDTVHGPWAKQTCDIHELCNYAAGRYDVVVWESVQQAYTKAGRPLVDYLVTDVFAPKHYRVAHLLLNAASFGNTQQRKRYFFVAYRDCFKFNVEPPTLPDRALFLYDAIWGRRERVTRAGDTFSQEHDYDEDTYVQLTPDEWHCVPSMPNGWCANLLARYHFDALPPKWQDTWTFRSSDIPFSMHTISRLNWLRPSPTLHSSAGRWLHPDLNRPLTVGELAAMMGWKRIPVGPNPIAQMAKGICPEVGEWLGRQIELCLTNSWGDDDFESSYDDRTNEWVGRDTTGELVKEFDMTRYTNKLFKPEFFHAHARVPKHRFNQDIVGNLRRPWKDVETSYLEHGVK